jgi:hypothetical protein
MVSLMFKIHNDQHTAQLDYRLPRLFINRGWQNHHDNHHVVSLE